MTDTDTASEIGRLIRRSDSTYDTQKLRVIARIDDDGVAVTERAGRPSLCRRCGRTSRDMEVVDSDRDRDARETWLTYECPCGHHATVGARQGENDYYYNGAPDWEARCLATGRLSEAELGTMAPFYFVHDRGGPEDTPATDNYGVLAGPLPTFRAAAAVKDRFERLDAKLSIARRDTRTVAECRLCGRRMIPDRASQLIDCDGNASEYECGECMKQELAPVLDALGEVFNTDLDL